MVSRNTIDFCKYQGTGNDFVVIDDRKENFDHNDFNLVKKLCHRKFGVGADGLILIRDHFKYDFEMLYFNSDGRIGSLCGNGSRCAVHFACQLGLFQKDTTFQTSEGSLQASVVGDMVHVKMPDVNDIISKEKGLFLDTGSPHLICFEDDGLDTLDVYNQGRDIRYSGEYAAEGTNVNFVQVLDQDRLFVRTYERGVENETLSCGTGVTASALAYALFQGASPVKIKTLGGDLTISFKRVGDRSFKEIYLIGPAESVFKGTIKLQGA
jgi:diaminopimelate epimerase